MSVAETLDSGRFVRWVQAVPPKGMELAALRGLALQVKGSADALEVGDNPEAVMRLSPLAVTGALAAGGPPIALRINSRDRNSIGFQSMVLGGAALGAQAVCVETGRDPAFSDHPDATAVHDLDPLGMVRAVAGLVAGKDLAGAELEGVPSLTIGAELDLWAPEGIELERAVQQAGLLARIGVGYFRVSAVYDPSLFLSRLELLAHLAVPVIADVGLLKSGGMARYINRNVPGCTVPDDLIKRVQKAPDKKEEAVKIAVETIAALRGQCAGVCVVPLGWDDLVPPILAATG